MKNLCTYIFEYCYDFCMKKKERTMLWKKRKRLLSDATGTVLEIWSWTGVNFQYYTSDADVTAIEPSKMMARKSKEYNIENIEILPFTLDEYLEHNSTTAQKQFDVIVCTLVLCSIWTYDDDINKIVELLKPWWRIIIIEHILSDNLFIAYLQHAFNPIQNSIAAGCNLNHTTDKLIMNHSKLKKIETNYFWIWNIFFYGKFEKY